MAKTRIQIIAPAVVKEEESENELKQTQHSKNISNQTRNASKIQKKKNTRKNSIDHSSSPQIKLEDESMNKNLLNTPKQRKLFSRSPITKTRLEQFISYIVNDKMTATAAAKKMNFAKSTGLRYYNQFKNDPEKKIPAPFKCPPFKPPPVTHEQIKTLIGYMEYEHMSLAAATKKMNISKSTGSKYYKQYLKDPEGKIPIPPKRTVFRYPPITQERIKSLISYIDDDNMTVATAAKKAQVSIATARKYYSQYEQDPQHKIPSPANNFAYSGRRISQEQVQELIGYIFTDGLSVLEAAKKANMAITTARRFYNKYLNCPDDCVPTESTPNTGKRCTQEQVDKLIHLIVNEGLSVQVASVKANMSDVTGGKYYYKYINDPNRAIPNIKELSNTSNKPCTQEQVNNLISHLVNDKLPMKAACEKVNMSTSAGRRYYTLYLHDPNRNMPKPEENMEKAGKLCTLEQIDELIGYIVNDKMSVSAASKKAKMSKTTARKYYARYMYDTKRNIPNPRYYAGIRSKPVTQDQIKDVIRYIKDDKMSLLEASINANMGKNTASRYYTHYLNDPNNNIPTQSTILESKVRVLVEYIEKEKLSVAAAAKKLRMSRNRALWFYNQYKDNQPNKEALLTRIHGNKTYEQVKNLIDYVERDKLTIRAAAAKAGIVYTTAYTYIRKFKELGREKTAESDALLNEDVPNDDDDSSESI